MQEEKMWKAFKWIFLAGLFGILLIWSMIQPFGAPPDEIERYKITEFILKYGKLPHGGDPEIMLEGWGFSYGFQPILPYILSAWLVRFVSIFSDSEYIYILAARLVNVITGVIMAYFVWKIGEELFARKSRALLFTVLVSFLPQAMFMHTYVNVDSMALMSSALIVYSWITGIKSQWDIKSCCMLGIGMGLCAMSYYNAYAFILCSIFVFAQSFVSWDKDNRRLNIEWKLLLKKGLIAGGIAFLLAGWWFIRSAVLYDGDFLGLRTRDAYAEIYAADHLKPSSAPTWKNAGFSIMDMFRQSDYLYLMSRSFVGMFEHMRLPLWNWMYPVYFVLLGGGLLGLLLLCKKKKCEYGRDAWAKGVFHISMFLCLVIPFILCTWVAYEMDYQPQGRYILPMLIPLMYYVTLGIEAIADRLFSGCHIDFGKWIIFGICLLFAGMALYAFKSIIFTKYYFNFITMFKTSWRTFLK